LSTSFKKASGRPASSKQKMIIHFSSGETLEDSDNEEEEGQSSGRSPFTEPTRRGFTAGLACDFLEESLASALGRNLAKHQKHAARMVSLRDRMSIIMGQQELQHIPLLPRKAVMRNTEKCNRGYHLDNI
uniref:Uncharacterized protein n=1 Tax=Monopterus albus TaxID=43700 RepID=A0A3Q3R622_MONAL